MSDLDKESMTGVCSNCGPVRTVLTGGAYRCKIARMISAHGKYRHGKVYRRWFLETSKELNVCVSCGVKNEDKRFFDVNHIDGDSDNNGLENLQVLCPNCHRLETIYQWNNNLMKKYKRNYPSI